MFIIAREGIRDGARTRGSAQDYRGRALVITTRSVLSGSSMDARRRYVKENYTKCSYARTVLRHFQVQPRAHSGSHMSVFQSTPSSGQKHCNTRFRRRTCGCTQFFNAPLGESHPPRVPGRSRRKTRAGHRPPPSTAQHPTGCHLKLPGLTGADIGTLLEQVVESPVRQSHPGRLRSLLAEHLSASEKSPAQRSRRRKRRRGSRHPGAESRPRQSRRGKSASRGELVSRVILPPQDRRTQSREQKTQAKAIGLIIAVGPGLTRKAVGRSWAFHSSSLLHLSRAGSFASCVFSDTGGGFQNSI